MSRELSSEEKKLLSLKIPKALQQGRKSYETKTESNDILVKAGYKPYFTIDHPTIHKDKKAKLNSTRTSAGTSTGTRIVAKAASKSKKDNKPSIVSKVCYEIVFISQVFMIITLLYIF